MDKIKNKKMKVLTLGVFHFDFPNLDVQQFDESEQIDVLEDKYQDEIEEIIEKLAKFKPTAIALEIFPDKQNETNDNYIKYLNKEYNLNRTEREQLGFRIAEKMNLKKIYCVNEWGDFDSDINKLFSDEDKTELDKFGEYIKSNTVVDNNSVFKEEGVLEELRRLNNPERIKNELGIYLMCPFKYESKEGDFLGVKFETGRWFSRNLKILRNIQRIPLESDDRLLIIYGAGHLNLLNIFFEALPEYDLVKTNDYLT